MRTIKTRHFTGTTDNTVTKRELENRKVARRAAAEGMVLLKNEGILPLKEGTKIALYGVGASRTIKGGTGSGDVNERETVSIYQGMKNGGFEITTEDWIKDFDEKYQAARYAWRDEIENEAAKLEDQVSGFFNVYSTTPFRMPAGAPVTQTDAEVAIYILSRVAGEGADRFDEAGDYYLTEEEKALQDRLQIFEMLEMYVMPHAQIQSIEISENTVTVIISKTNLNIVSSIVAMLEGDSRTSYVSVSTAQTGEDKNGKTVTANLVIGLKAGGETDNVES